MAVLYSECLLLKVPFYVNTGAKSTFFIVYCYVCLVTCVCNIANDCVMPYLCAILNYKEYRISTKFLGGLIFAFFADGCVIAKFYHHKDLLLLVTIHILIN